MARLHVKGILVFIVLLLQGCSYHQVELNQLAQELDKGRAGFVLSTVESRDYPERDLVQYKLALGLLKAVNGDFPGAVTELQVAKQAIAVLKKTSISENIGAVSINETLRSYVSGASEQMLLQQLLALSYLLQNDLDGARVEVLQMQEIAKTLPEDGLSGQVASSFYLAGLIYEMGGEYDDAMISYRRAYTAMHESATAVPKALRDSLLFTSHRIGLDDEYDQYVKEFGYQFSSDKADSQLAVLYWDGVVSAKQQRFLSVYAPGLGYNISLALPYYNDFYGASIPLNFSVLDKALQTEMLDDVEKLARADLDAEANAIYAATLARVLVKQTALHKVRERDESGIATLLLNITTMISESADVRSWNMLPASIQIQRVNLPAGNYFLQPPSQLQNMVISRQPLTATTPQATITKLDLAAGKTSLLFVSSASNKAFYYAAP